MACFRAGQVTGIEPVAGRDDRVLVAIVLQLLDNIPFHIFANAFRDTLAIVQQRLNDPPDREKAEALLADVRKTIFDPLERAVPFTIGGQSVIDLAYRQKVPYRHLGLGTFRLGWGSKARLLHFCASDGDSQIGKELCGNKQMTAHLLRSAGYPGAEHTLVGSAEQAVKAAEALGWPVVVKPPNRERSEGVTTDIRNRDDLVAAYREASQCGSLVLVEKHVPGLCHRILVANGQIIYVVKRKPKGVVGDGRQSVAELVAEANRERMKKPPWRRIKECPLDAEADACLAGQGLTRDSIPPQGQRVNLRVIESTRWGGDTDLLTHRIHPENARLAIDVTRYLGMSITGFDLITTDITRPWHETGAVINEVNFSPDFRWHNREEDSGRVVNAILGGDGRIPGHLVAGEGDLLARARELRARLEQDGVRYHLTTARYSEDADGAEIPMEHDTLFDRSLALVFRPDVDAFIMAGGESELFQHGMAVDRLVSATVVQADEARAQRLLQALQAQVVVGSVRRVDP